MKAIAVLSLALALGLGGCTLTEIPADIGLVTSATVTSQKALIAENIFNGLETIAAGYQSLPLCGTAGVVTCRTPVASAEIDGAVKSGRIARDNIQGLVRTANGGPIPVASYNTLQAAITSIKAITGATS